jgi:hypothetical protein
MASDESDIVPLIEDAVALLRRAIATGSDTHPLIIKQLKLAIEMSERCADDLKESRPTSNTC